MLKQACFFSRVSLVKVSQNKVLTLCEITKQWEHPLKLNPQRHLNRFNFSKTWWVAYTVNDEYWIIHWLLNVPLVMPGHLEDQSIDYMHWLITLIPQMFQRIKIREINFVEKTFNNKSTQNFGSNCFVPKKFGAIPTFEHCFVWNFVESKVLEINVYKLNLD